MGDLIFGGLIPAIGITLIVVGIIWLYGIALSRNIWLGLLSIVIPVILLVLVTDEAGQKAWGCIVLGVVLAISPFILSVVFGG